MAILVVFSTLSLTVNKHFCGGNLVDASIFSEVKKCGVEGVAKNKIQKKSCCKDEAEVIKGQDDLELNNHNQLSLDQVVFVQSFFASYKLLYSSLPKKIVPHKDYSPPLIVRDIQLRDATFLI